MDRSMRMTVIMSLIMVLGSTGVSVVSEAPSAFDDSEMNDNDVMVIGGLYDLAPKSRLRPSATQAKNARRGFQILDSLGLCFGRDQDANLVLMPKPAQTRSGWAFWAAVGAVVALGAINPAFGLAGAVGAVLEAPEAKKDEKSPKVDFKALLKEKAEEQTWKIIEPMLEGELPAWVKPWRCNGVDVTVPFNADPRSQAHNGFKGGNRIRLSALWTGYHIPMWATTKQWYAIAKRIGFDYSKETGTPVMKEGSRDCFTVTLRPLPDKTNTWYQEKIDRHGNPVLDSKGKVKLVKRYGVQFGKFAYTAMFNIEQTNLPVDAVAALADFTMSQPERVEIEGASDMDEMCLKNVEGVTLNHGGDRAYFRPATDQIQMPHPDTFTENGVSALEAYSATLLHEFAHATGHKSRLRRSQMSGGELNYAREELVAEMASMICCHALSIKVDGPQHGTYLKSWANRAVGKHKKDEDPDKWVSECQTLLRKAMEASEWVLYGTVPEWLLRERTKPAKEEDKTEEEDATEDATEDAEVVFHRATPDEIENAPLVREIGGGRDAPSTDREAVYADMGLVSTTTTGDVHYGPFSPPGSWRHNGVIHHEEEVVSMVIPGDDFDSRIICLGTGEVLAVMKVGEGHHRIGWDENGGVYVTYPEMGWVSIPAPQRAIGAFGFTPALLDPSMVTMVALGVAMVVNHLTIQGNGPHRFNHYSGDYDEVCVSPRHNPRGMMVTVQHRFTSKDDAIAFLCMMSGGGQAYSRVMPNHPDYNPICPKGERMWHYYQSKTGARSVLLKDYDTEYPARMIGGRSVPILPEEESAHSAFMPLGIGMALLDPSMASMVALGIAMVVGMTKITETEQRWLPWSENDSMGIATHTIEDNARGYNDRKKIGQIWSAMVGCGERQIEDLGFGKDITIRNKGNERACIHRVVLRTGSKKEVVPSGNEVMVTREKATLTLFAKAKEYHHVSGPSLWRQGTKTFEVGVVLTGYLREEYGEVEEDIVTTSFRIDVSQCQAEPGLCIMVKEGFESQMLRRDYNTRDSGMKLDREFIAAIAESNEIIEDALTLMLGYGGRTHDSGDFSKGHIIQTQSEAKNSEDRFSVYHDFTEPWEKYGASAVDDLAKECYEAYEKYKRADEWSKVTWESQKALDAILRYGSLPAQVGDSDAAWNRVSADALGTLALDLELAERNYNGIHMKREISNVIQGGDWKTRLAYIEHKGNHSWNAPIKKSGLITLIQTFLRRDALVRQSSEEFREAVKAYTDGCVENEVCWTEAMLNKPRFKEIESDLASLLNHEQSKALMSIWAHSHYYEHDYNEPICQVNIPCKDGSEIVTFKQDNSVFQERPFDCEEMDESRHISQALSMMEAGLERVGLLSEDDQQVMGDFKSLKNSIARLEKGLAAFEEFRYTCRHMFNHIDGTEGVDLWLDHGAISGVVQAKVERRYPNIMDDGLPEETEAEAMGAVGAFALLPALLDPSLTTLVALGACVALSMVKTEEEVVFYRATPDEIEAATPMRPNASIKTLWDRKYRSAIPWLSWLPGLDDPVSIHDLVVEGVPRDAHFGRRLEHMNEKGLEYRAKYKEYESGVKARNQEALEARGKALVSVAPEGFYDGLDQYEKGCYVQLQIGEPQSRNQVEEIEECIKDLSSKEPWHRYVNALYDANLLDCEKVRYPEEDRYQDGWCECCKKPDMMDDPDNTVIRWWMRGAYTDRFVTLAKRIQRAFNSREIGFWYEVGEARPDDKGLYRCPVTVIHGPVSDSGWSALAIIEAFDPEQIKEGTDALVSMVPTGMEKATYEATLEDGTKETVEYNKPVWEEKTSIEVTGFLEGRFGSPMFQYDPTICDHCGKKAHNRKKLVVVKHEDEGHRIVGSSCLYEYTDIDPKTLENLFNLTENWNPFEGLATDPESWTKGINKRDLTDFLRPLGVVLGVAGAYTRGSGSRAFDLVMGDDLMENTDNTHDVHRKEIDPRMAYYFYRKQKGIKDPTGWYPVTKGSVDWDLVEDVKNYIKDGIQTNVDMVANNENPGDFGRTLAIVGRAGYVTAFSKGRNKATVNVVAGSASRFFRARKDKMEAEAKGDKATKAFPIEPSEMLKKWEGSIKATVCEVKYIEKYEAHVNTLLTDNGYSITVWSSNKKIIENLFGEVEIYRFVPTRINTFKGDESLQVKTIGVREVKA